MPSLSISDSASALIAGLMFFILVWLIVLTVIVRRLSVARKNVGAAVKGTPEVFDVIDKAVGDIDSLAAKYERLAIVTKRNRGLISETIRHLGIVRFDAFVDVGGRLSFAAALLDDDGNGLVISSISGRSEGRVYAKPIVDRRSEFPLSEEEEEAIRKAFEVVST